MKLLKTVLIVLAALIVFRLFLPTIVKKYVNKTLSELDDYSGSVQDIDIFLLGGSYTINGLVINKKNNNNEVPFLNLPSTDLSIQWKSLWKGEVVSEIICNQPEVNFAFSEDEESSQTGVEEDWTKVIKDLMPIRINRFVINNGKVNLINAVTQPKTDLALKGLNAELLNLQNVTESSKKLPSPVKATANLEGFGGRMEFNANMLLLKEIPDFEYDLKLLDMEATQLNPMSEYYANLNFEKGSVSIISELALYDNKLKGYFKPIGNDVVVFRFKEDQKRNFKQFFTELFVEVGKTPLTNIKKDQVAAIIPVEGNIDNIESSFWPILFSSVKNAYIKAFEKKVENKEFFSEL